MDYRRGGGRDDPRGRARRVILVGAGVCAGAAIVTVLPGVMRYVAMEGAGKYVVALGFVGGCVGMTLMLNGVVDWWRGK